MPIRTTLEDERGEVIDKVSDPYNILHKLLPAVKDKEYRLINFIDRYGHTVFNRLQMETFLEEWARIEQKNTRLEDWELYSRIKELAMRCKNEVHLYLKFRGD